MICQENLERRRCYVVVVSFSQIAVAQLPAKVNGDMSGGATLDARRQMCNVEDKMAVTEAYLLSLLRRRYNGVIFPNLAGMDATISESGSPREWGTVFVGRERFAFFDAVAVLGSGWVRVLSCRQNGYKLLQRFDAPAHRATT